MPNTTPATAEHLTHWKKNLDSRYISGEDLANSLKGLRPEMVVVIEKFEDAETFDQNQNKKTVKTGFWLKELNANGSIGASIYKPVLLNNTNAAFCAKEFGSEFMEHWLNKPMVLYAMPDKRHGMVARFKKYYAPNKATDTNALASLGNSKTLDELQTNWSALSKEEKLLPTVIAKKDSMKTQLSTPA